MYGFNGAEGSNAMVIRVLLLAEQVYSQNSAELFFGRFLESARLCTSLVYLLKVGCRAN